MLSKLTRHISDNWYFYVLIIPLLLLMYSIFDDRHYIAGDVMIPIDPHNNLHKLSLWYSGKESLHYLHTLWYLYYSVFPLFGLSGLIAQKVLIVLTYTIGFFSTYFLHKELFQGKPYGSKQWAYITALIFTFNPIHFLLVINYLPLYGFPLCLYLLLKSIKSRKIIYPISTAIAINFFFFIDLPQPKALIIFAFASVMVISAHSQLNKIITINLYKRIIRVALIVILLNLWVLIPFVYSLVYGQISDFAKQVPSHGGVADLGSAQLQYISRMFNLSVLNSYPAVRPFLGSWLYSTWSYILWGIIALGLFTFNPPHKKEKRTFSILLIGTILLLFLAKGPNPPLGSIYTYMTLNVPLFRIFRTTSSVIIGSVFFYSALISLSLYALTKKNQNKKIVQLLIIIHIIIFAPQYIGARYYNNFYNDSSQKGFKIPHEYFQMAAKLDTLSDDNMRVLSIPSTDGYQEKTWNYSGADIISWTSRAEFISPNSVAGLNQFKEELVNDPTIALNSPTVANYILIQKDSLRNYRRQSAAEKHELVMEDQYFDLFKTQVNLKLNLFHSSSPGINPNISYQQRSIADYVVTITTTSNEDFLLTFNDSYHPGWILSGPSQQGIISALVLPQALTSNIGLQSDNLINQWRISPLEICKQLKCEQEDGNYIVELRVIFWPQRLFYFSLILSAGSVILILGYTYLYRREYEISKKK